MCKLIEKEIQIVIRILCAKLLQNFLNFLSNLGIPISSLPIQIFQNNVLINITLSPLHVMQNCSPSKSLKYQTLFTANFVVYFVEIKVVQKFVASLAILPLGGSYILMR